MKEKTIILYMKCVTVSEKRMIFRFSFPFFPSLSHSLSFALSCSFRSFSLRSSRSRSRVKSFNHFTSKIIKFGSLLCHPITYDNFSLLFFARFFSFFSPKLWILIHFFPFNLFNCALFVCYLKKIY